MNNRFTDCSRIAKTHFAFCRVNVYVDRRGIDFEKEATDRVAPFHQRRVIAFHQGEIQTAILHRAFVDEEMLILACGA